MSGANAALLAALDAGERVCLLAGDAALPVTLTEGQAKALRAALGWTQSPPGFLTDDTAMAAVVLWGSGLFDTLSIATVLQCREDAVCRTLHMAGDAARQNARRATMEAGHG